MEKTSWDQLHSEIALCKSCLLHENCKQKVPGQGAGKASVMLIGEGPGQREDETGIAFSGPAGQLLTQMLKSIQIERKEVYITNIVKCRPPQNRAPLPQERQSCLPFLRKQVTLVKPKVILLLGATALNTLLGENLRITKVRGEWIVRKNIHFMPTFHPSALLRDEKKKPFAWKDLQKVRNFLLEKEKN